MSLRQEIFTAKSRCFKKKALPMEQITESPGISAHAASQPHFNEQDS
jgi:hypothetical protein